MSIRGEVISDDALVCRVARAYGVTLRRTHLTREVVRREMAGFCFGPTGGAYNPLLREVLIAKDQAYRGVHDIMVLHEIAHCVMAVPFTNHAEVPEEFCLLQWEERVARQYGFDMARYADFRGTTRIRSEASARFRDIRNPKARAWWLGGEITCVWLRVFSPSLSFNPGVWPDWNNLKAADRLALEEWRQRGYA